MIVNGKNLKFLIDSPYSMLGDWSSFALCYSIRKFLPEAEIYIKSNKFEHFKWANKLKVKYNYNAYDLLLQSTCLMIRPLDDTTIFNVTNLVSEAKLDKFTPFVSYNESCGKFVTADWIHNNECPFPYADKFATKGMCPNELQVLKLWKQVGILYPMLVRG